MHTPTDAGHASAPVPPLGIDSPSDLLARLHAAEARAEKLMGELDRAERLATLGTTAAIVAHEFNNILTPVLSYAQLAQASRDNVELVNEALQRTVEAVIRATEIGSSILGFVRSDAGIAPRADVGECVRNAIRCLARSPERDGVRLEVSVSEGIFAAIRPIALQQVMLNLALNACEAMRRGGGSLSVHAAISAANAANGASGGRTIQIIVSDTGAGIAPELTQRMFEPFVSAREDGSGTGLGLAVCKRLIEESRGAIEVVSAVGSGTVFTIILPEADAAHPAGAEPTECSTWNIPANDLPAIPRTKPHKRGRKSA